MLGKRDPKKYGKITLMEIINKLRKQGKRLDCELDFFQSNHEGAIIDFLQKNSSRKSDGLIINPGALIRYAYSLRQALVDFNKPFIELHMADINKTGVNKKVNILDDVPNRIGQISGLKEKGYFNALEKIVNFIKKI
jgi:3-dehydroquinate dehydratase-2